MTHRRLKGFPMRPPPSDKPPVRLPWPQWLGAVLAVATGCAGLALWGLSLPLGTLPLAISGALLVAGPAALMALAAWRLHRTRRRLADAGAMDRVTGLASRVQFMQQAEREWSRSRRYGEDAALLLLEADRLGEVVEDHGARCGDALLHEVARAPTQQLRAADLLGRVNATRLAIYLPNTDPLGALDVAERIRDRVAAALLRWDREALSTTVSIGVASAGAGHATLDALLRDAEAALAAARLAGGNCQRAAPLQPRRSLLRGPTQGNRRAQRG
jgi:diguanylate cyclase (GGDEF)-like protein